MPDKKLTDNDIKKALECCTTNGASCKDCPAFVKVDRSNCKKYFRGALDLINRLEEKNSNLTSDLISLKEKFELLKTEKDNLIKTYSECQVANLNEFAERLKALFPSDNEPYLYWEIHEGAENILKEMGG
ncbi:MAG: hypothetical protein IKV81_03750 [Clostridia bacterium]|nr:hypothetical protein [Clostridia bacterium]